MVALRSHRVRVALALAAAAAVALAAFVLVWSNGPLLRVYLSAARAEGPGDAFDDRFLDLRALKGNIGAQNYAIPPRTDLRDFRSVVVWCKRFGVPFAAAAVTSGAGSA